MTNRNTAQQSMNWSRPSHSAASLSASSLAAEFALPVGETAAFSVGTGLDAVPPWRFSRLWASVT